MAAHCISPAATKTNLGGYRALHRKVGTHDYSFQTTYFTSFELRFQMAVFRKKVQKMNFATFSPRSIFTNKKILKNSTLLSLYGYGLLQLFSVQKLP